MVKLIAPLDIYLKEILPYLKECIQKQCGTQEVEVICITKVGNQIQMRDTFPTNSVNMQIEMLDGILATMKAGRIIQ